VVTGTRADGSGLDVRRLAATPGTLVIFMGLRHLGEIAAGLIAAGRPASEPAAVASRLSLPDYGLRIGTLGTIAGLAEDVQTPALVIVGAVVGLGKADRHLDARLA
jgi:siroheme synthase